MWQLIRTLSTASWMEQLFLWVGLFVWLSSAVLIMREIWRNRSKSLERILSNLKEKFSAFKRFWTSAAVPTVDHDPVPALKIVVPRPRWIEILSVAVIITFSSTVGYFYRDHQELQNTFTFHDVLIVKQEPPKKWLLSTAYTGEWWITLCGDYTPNWEPGYRLKILVYEDRGCKRLSGSKLGYVIDRDEYGNPLKGD